jgi:hypothetical protein
MAKLPEVVKLGNERYSGSYLRSVTEAQAIKVFKHKDRGQVVNAWKQANGLSVPNYTKKKKVAEDQNEVKAD